MKWSIVMLLCLMLLAAGCQPALPATVLPNPVTATAPVATATLTPTLLPTTRPPTLWVSPNLPAAFWDGLQLQDALLNFVEVPQDADLRIEVLAPQVARQAETKTPWLYVLAAPFNTSLDGITYYQLHSLWQGIDTSIHLVASTETSLILSGLLGQPSAENVTLLPPTELLAAAWQQENTWAILPFEELQPRWKVLRIDDRSVLDASLNPQDYPLTVWLGISGLDLAPEAAQNIHLPLSNRNLNEMTTVIMTGTTALVRHTAEQMELQGITYPAEGIAADLLAADLTHISNEAPFYSQCPPALPYRTQARFCSSPRYMQLLEYIDVDLVELTGNHLMDWGPEAFLESLQLYAAQGISTYGGGADQTAAQKPFLFEHHGNRLAFIGCNAAGPETDFATPTSPGALRCDNAWLADEIAALKAAGYLPVVTFQHYEVEDNRAPSALRTDFRTAADAGAVIVSGSQSHVAQGFAFRGDAFLSYGLGNLFFDQMFKLARPGLIERHVFYRGRHISTEVLTTNLENSARRVPLTGSTRSELLEKLFEYSDWGTLP